MDKTTQEIIKFTKKLVSTPPQNFINSEKAVAELVTKKLQAFGFKPKILGPKKLPYLARELAEDKNFKGSLFLGFDADEQTGNLTGIKEIMKQAPKADVCVLGYQGMEEISIGARGWLRLKISTLGKAAHTGSRSKKGVNAIHNMGKVIVAISSLNLARKTEPFFEFGSALNIAQINGGIAINIIPDKCEALIDIRLIPSQTKNEVLTKINQVLEKLIKKDENFKYHLEVLQYGQAYLTNPNSEFVRLIGGTAKKILGKDIPLVASGQLSDGNILSQLKMPIINAFGCESGEVHAPNEWLNLNSISKVFEIYRQTIKEFCE